MAEVLLTPGEQHKEEEEAGKSEPLGKYLAFSFALSFRKTTLQPNCRVHVRKRRRGPLKPTGRQPPHADCTEVLFTVLSRVCLYHVSTISSAGRDWQNERANS